ncbi:uncharacterized protein LOC144744093 [Ciona intestinalis]
MSDRSDSDTGYCTNTEESTDEEDVNPAVAAEENALNEVNYLEEDYGLLLGLGDFFQDHASVQPNLNQIREERLQRTYDILSEISPYYAKEVMHINKELSKEDAAAVCIQKHFRGYLGRKVYLERLMDYFEHEEELRKIKERDQMEEAELLIKNHQLENEIEDEILGEKNRQRRKLYYVITIQRAWRKFKEKTNKSEVHQIFSTCDTD